MFHLSDVRPFSDYKLKPADLSKHFETTRSPLSLPPNGTTEVVLQEAESCRMLLNGLGATAPTSRDEARGRNLTTS